MSAGARFYPSEETVSAQARAADPRASAFVAANAGSGKTTVLVQRVVRLLLSGVEPGRILCITFTKAAAANMANRVFDRLSRWTTLDDAALAAELERLEGRLPGAAELAAARRLFAAALETPGGLKIFTIHALCERLLHQFPFEANVPAAFSVLDDRGVAELVAHARAETYLEATADPQSPLGRAFAATLEEAGESKLATALDEALRRRSALAGLLPQLDASAVEALGRRLTRALNLPEGATLQSVEEAFAEAGPGEGELKACAEWLALGSTKDQETAACLRRALAESHGDARTRLHLEAFCTKEGKLRAAVGTQASRKARPDLAAILDREIARVDAYLEARKAVTLAERSLALTLIAATIRSRYETSKARRNALDFDDLIAKTRDLLQRTASAWVRFKLDEGLDHVLVDEAQDTSPDQWEIVLRLTEEFIAGEGARGPGRTVFAVGDEKQSIFGFQGARPEKFDEVRRDYARGHEAVGLTFHAVRLSQSFRSAEAIVGSVDKVFSRPEAYAGLEAQASVTVHDTARRGAIGRVEIWPLVPAPPKLDLDRAWNAPFDELSSQSPVAILADRIAVAVRGWMDGRDALGRCPPVSPGDILILVRSRGALFDQVLRSLKQRGVPVSGADRLVLNSHIATLDLLALGDAVLNPRDDLALASVLKSPLFGLDEDDLIRIAPERTGTLRAALAASAQTDLMHQAAFARLETFEALARRCTPFAFYARVLGPERGRLAFRSRLGGEADDVLDEFLRLAQNFGRANTPTLAGFLAFMRAAPTEVKRDLDVAGEEVRVMTVHGSKGLEAKLVVLADLGAPQTGRHDPCVFDHRESYARPSQAPLLLWSTAQKDDVPLTAGERDTARRLAQEEHRRLLYVALTRAEDRLVVAGHLGLSMKDAPAQSWYGLVREGLAPHCTAAEVESLGGTVLIYGTTDVDLAGNPAAPRLAVVAERPEWLRTAPADAAAPQRATPSGARAGAVPEAAVSRGRLLHRLLEVLPGLPGAALDEAARALLAAEAPGLGPAERQAVVEEARALLEDPALGFLFAPDALREVPVGGEVTTPAGHRLSVSGRVDRLLRGPEGILIVDFKTDQPVPARPPRAYRIQLALYAAVLAKVFPEQPVAAGILWTAARRFDRVGAGELAEALESVAES